MSFIEVDGKSVKTPSEMTWGLQDISSSSAGRTQDSKMHKERVSQKRTISFTWNGLSPSEASKILKAFNPEYIDVKYFDPMENGYKTKNFYVGDRTAPFKIWTVGQKRISQVAFDIIER